jgi:alginate O-acetyltransferase complex protein AlgI
MHCPKVLRVLYTFGVVSLGWVLFRSESFSQAWYYYECLFSPLQWSIEPAVFWGQLINPRGECVLVVALLVSVLPLFWPAADNAGSQVLALPLSSFKVVVFSALALCATVLVVFSLASSGFSPFLYFRF